MSDSTNLENKLPFFDKLSESEKELVNSNIHAVHFDKDQPVYQGECACIGLLLVTNGSLRIFITSPDGREVTLYRLFEGDLCVLSASCILKHIDFDVSIEAETNTDALQIGSPILSRLMKENVYVELFCYKLATDRFSDVMWVMQQILFTSFDKRLAAFILEECQKNHTDTLYMTHEQIARYLGSAREVVSRMLKYFEKEGLVTLFRGGFTVLDKKKLETFT